MAAKVFGSWVDLFSIALVVIGTLFAYQLLGTFSQTQNDRDKKDLWARLESVGVPSSGGFAWTRAVISSISSLRKNAHEGYSRISKARKLPFALPSMWTGGAIVVLPPSLLSLLNRPSTELSGFQALLETLCYSYIFSDREIYEKVIHFDVVRKTLARREFVASLADITSEETNIAFLNAWGTSKDWKNMNAWNTCERVIIQASMRVMLGLPSCRDESLLKLSISFANSVLSTSALINCFPPFLRPIIGPVLASPSKYYLARCKKMLVPLVEERIRFWEENEENLPVCTWLPPCSLSECNHNVS
jgi:hypothetical protein